MPLAALHAASPSENSMYRKFSRAGVVEANKAIETATTHPELRTVAPVQPKSILKDGSVYLTQMAGSRAQRRETGLRSRISQGLPLP